MIKKCGKTHRVHVVGKVADMEDGVKVATLRLLLQPRQRLCVFVTHVSKDGEPRRPLAALQRHREPEHLRPPQLAAAVVL